MYNNVIFKIIFLNENKALYNAMIATLWLTQHGQYLGMLRILKLVTCFPGAHR